ncbi:hypothetical protein Pelo_2780 [Pelomyxa schiedti]|nr:hypothetical protein Pelo_2780 [Pelomyxa schiedti]
MEDAKMVLLGDTSVGKTALAQRFVNEAFTGDLTTTIGASYFSKQMFVEGIGLRLQIWDTAGQERLAFQPFQGQFT